MEVDICCSGEEIKDVYERVGEMIHETIDMKALELLELLKLIIKQLAA